MSDITDVTVRITGGRIRGTVKGGVNAFKGIPYGTSTGGNRRFLPPSASEPWTDVRNATEFGPIAPQVGILASPPPRENGSPRMPEPQDEDCLVLNVWSTGVSDGGRRPVMVWLHGRGFYGGSGSEVMYHGDRLAKRGDVVVVTINHRLNVFGYTYLADLGGERFAASGMAGMLDVVLALEWIRDNIEVFGGDPGNVTVFGESGGGAKVSTLLAMPAAKGLFHRAIIQSGPGIRALERDEATELSRRLLAHLGISQGDVESLQQVEPSRMLEAMRAAEPTAEIRYGGLRPLRFRPVVDGEHLPAHPFDPIAPPTAAEIPVLIGTNKDEAALFLQEDPKCRVMTDHELEERLIPVLGNRRGEVLATYRRTRPNDSPWDLYVGILSERTRLGSIALAERQAAKGAAVYMYLMTWESDYRDGLLKAAHTLDIPFIFDKLDVPFVLDSLDSMVKVGSRPDRFELRDAMSGAWVAFARNGKPSHEGIPEWPRFTAEWRDTMIFDVPCYVDKDPRRAERLAWEGIVLGL